MQRSDTVVGRLVVPIAVHLVEGNEQGRFAVGMTMRAAGSRLALLFGVVLLVGCDHVTKLAVKAELEGERPRQVLRGVLDLQYAQNTDVAFNLLRWVPERVRAPLLAVAGGVALLALSVARILRAPRARAARIGLALVAAGALGNYLDRILRGYVVDFVYLHHWPVFNVADVYVTVGAALLAWSSLSVHRSSATA